MITTLTKTLVIVTVSGVGKTWYKEHEELHPKDTLVFDMGYYKEQITEDQYRAFLNLIYITRKNNINSIIMINYSSGLYKLLRIHDIPTVTFLPKNRYRFCKDNMDLFGTIMHMDHNMPRRRFFNDDQYLSDRIDIIYADKFDTEEQWKAFDIRNKLYK